MKLQSKKARIPIAALGVTALIAGAGALVSPAFAAGPALAITPATTTVNTVNLGAAASTNHTGTSAGTYDILQPHADATYSLRVTSGVASLKLSLDSYTPPTGVTPPALKDLFYAQMPTSTATASGPTSVPGAANLAAWKPITPGASPVEALLTGGGAVANTNVFLAPAAPGTYVIHFVDPGAQGGTDDDSVSPSVTLNVKDAFAATTGGAIDLTDDWAPTVTNSALSVGIGAPLATTVGLSSLTLLDARSTSSGIGVLASKVGGLVGVRFSHSVGNTGTQWTDGTNATAYTASAAVSAAGTRTIPVGVTSAAGTITATAAFDRVGNGIDAGDTDWTTTAATDVATNSVGTVPTLVATDVVGSVKQAAGSGAVAVKPGVAAVTYSATVNPVAASKVVYFTVYANTGTAAAQIANIAKLSTNGTVVDTSSTTSKIYSAITDALGVASLKVTSSDPKALDTYKVAASSNGHAAIAYSPLTVLYADPSGSSAMITSTVADLTPDLTTTSVTIKGKVTDQFGSAYQPASSASQQAQLFVGTNAVSCTAVTFARPTAPAAGNATIVGGEFTFTYTPTTAPLSGTCTPIAIGYDGDGNASIAVAEADTDSINWASTTAAGVVTLTSPTDAAIGVNLSKSSVIASGQTTATTGTGIGADADDFGDAAGQITGTVTDASNAPLPYKTVTLTGTDGVYFSSSATGSDLVPSLAIVSNNVGVFGGGYAFFTKPGTAKVTATAGAVFDAASVTTDPSTDPFKVTVNDASGTPGSTLIVTGSLKDFFNHPVPSWGVSLSVGTSTVGGLSSSTPVTNPEGIYSTSFISGANQSGEVQLTATIPNQTTNVVPVVGWTTIAKLPGLPPHGEYMDQATIAVTNTKLTLVAQARVTSSANGARTLLSGTFLPNTSVDIYAKESGAMAYQFIDTAMTDAEGEWGVAETIKKSTYFLARSSGLSSPSDQTQVYSRVSISAKALGGGRVSLYANGDPNAKAPIVFYRAMAGVDPKLRGIISGSYGSARVTVSLPRGTRYVYATYQAAGTGKGTSPRIPIAVK
jgi:hypothetical protein